MNIIKKISPNCFVFCDEHFHTFKVSGKCVDSVTYEPTRFGKSDYIDNDCDGHVDEELCVGEMLNRGEMSAYPYHELEFEPGPLTGFYEQSRNMEYRGTCQV